MKKVSLLILTLSLGLFLSSCGSAKVAAPTPTPTPKPKLSQVDLPQKPDISLTPRDDGHLIYLNIANIPANIKSLEYELLYTAVDNKMEIEKGAGDTIKEVTPTIKREILLGTSSCTNGCKYKYDVGIVGGQLTLTFYTTDNGYATFVTPFTLKAAADVKKDKQIVLKDSQITAKLKAAKPAGTFYVFMKNYQGGYLMFNNSGPSNEFSLPSSTE